MLLYVLRLPITGELLLDLFGIRFSVFGSATFGAITVSGAVDNTGTGAGTYFGFFILLKFLFTTIKPLFSSAVKYFIWFLVPLFLPGVLSVYSIPTASIAFLFLSVKYLPIYFTVALSLSYSIRSPFFNPGGSFCLSSSSMSSGQK